MFDDLKRACYDANMRLPALGLVVFTFGNASCVDRARGVFAIKPSGVEYDRLTPDQMVVVSLTDGKVVDGSLRPSSDTNTHLVLYRAFPSVGGIVHTHSAYAVAWAQARRDVPIYGTTHADHLSRDIPCTDFMPDDRIRNDYETETGLQITEMFTARHLDPSEVRMALVAGHGPFAWGPDDAAAVYNAKILEELCRMALLTEQVRPGTPRLKDSMIRKHYERKHGNGAYYGQK